MDFKILPIQKEKNTTNEFDSLYRMFNSEYFNIDMLMIYLIKSFSEKKAGVTDFLVNKLYSINEEEIEFYLPELWF